MTRSEGRVLVVGAGLAGMTAAHHVAEWGGDVTLVDSAPHIGGAFLLLDHTFTTDSCGICIALPRQPSTCPTLASASHPRVTPLAGTTLTTLEGEAGRFTATLRRGPRHVDPERCDSCGLCAEVCPETRTRSRWGRFLGDDLEQQKAIYPAPPRAEPNVYALDAEACTRCGACVTACPRDAIDLDAVGGEERIDVEAVVLAPGFTPFDASQAFEYGWGRCENVVTNLEFERMLNRSGPTKGRVVRPSDGVVPQRIGFIHCVGSRSEALDRPYCSSSCCMITAKQVGMSKEAMPEAELTVFTMDVRTAGKGYERYFQRVADLPDVHYRRGRPAAVHELPGSQDLRLLTPEGEEVVDLLVLAVGMGPCEGVEALAESAGVALDERGFVLAGDDGLGTTSRPGVFCAGSGAAPADVPETVTEAAAAAALTSGVLTSGSLKPEVGTDVEDGGRSEETSGTAAEDRRMDAEDLPPRAGVFICSCRGELSEMLDIEALAADAEGLRGVGTVERVDAACELSGIKAMEHAVAEQSLNRVVVAGCSPHLYGERLEAMMERLEMPTRLLERVNIREGAAWPHGGNRAAATAVARGEIAMAVSALRVTPDLPVTLGEGPSATERVLVVGGGLSGMTAALTLDELGVSCDLVEKEADLGGHLEDAHRTLEGLDAQALLEETVARVGASDRVRVWQEAELVAWSGTQGSFEASIQVEDEVLEERYGALIVATGAEAAETSEYLYGQHPGVVTQRELEHGLADGMLPLSPSELRSVVMIQCVGSRDDEHPYCSRVCCGHAVKNALTLKKLDSSIDVSVLYRDIRTPGTRELAYREARRQGVNFVRYEPLEKPVVEAAGERLRITVRDTLYDETLTLNADVLGLSTGIEASPGNGALAELLGVELDEDGFFAEVHPKLRPTDLPRPGLFLCGMAYGPRLITESVGQGRAAALRAALSLSRAREVRQDAALVTEKLCSFCGLCAEACPYGARVLDHEDRVARVIDTLCQGCGACVAICPNGASHQPAFETARALAAVDAALDGVRVSQ